MKFEGLTNESYVTKLFYNPKISETGFHDSRELNSYRFEDHYVFENIQIFNFKEYDSVFPWTDPQI
jgi:hypothetical protein